MWDIRSENCDSNKEIGEVEDKGWSSEKDYYEAQDCNCYVFFYYCSIV